VCAWNSESQRANRDRLAVARFLRHTTRRTGPYRAVRRVELSAASQFREPERGISPQSRAAICLNDDGPCAPYLAERGIEPATAAEFGVGFYARTGLMQGRIVLRGFRRNQPDELGR
jgi:hypothetical protein